MGYLLGLGDRHLDNILLDKHTGRVVHIDYNIVFDMGQQLRVSEIVPFRLTHTLQVCSPLHILTRVMTHVLCSACMVQCAKSPLLPALQEAACLSSLMLMLCVQIQAALGVTGVEGGFRQGCEHILRVARQHSGTLSSLLQAILTDPLVTWAPGKQQASSKKV